MPSFSESIWWFILGGFAGWLVWWLLDKTYRRDGEAAAARERRDVEALTATVSELREERAHMRVSSDESNRELQRLGQHAESLIDSGAKQQQQITNLETALDAAREQSQPRLDQISTELDQIKNERQSLAIIVDSLQEKMSTKQDEIVQLNTEISGLRENANKSTGEAQHLTPQGATGQPKQNNEKPSGESDETPKIDIDTVASGEPEQIFSLPKQDDADSPPPTKIDTAAILDAPDGNTQRAEPSLDQRSQTDSPAPKQRSDVEDIVERPSTREKDKNVTDAKLAKVSRLNTQDQSDNRNGSRSMMDRVTGRRRDNESAGPDIGADRREPGLISRLRGAFSRKSDLD